MRIALIAPPFHGSARGLPLGLAHLAAMLEVRGFEVAALDMTVSKRSLSSFLEELQPDVVGISAVCATYLEAVAVAETSRTVLGSSVKIVVGGPHVAFGADTILQRRPVFDVCVIGEAEYSLVELCEAFGRSGTAAWKAVPGIAFNDSGAVRRSVPRVMTEKLDELPLPARAYFPEKGYVDAVGTFEVGASNKAELIASRGCPYPCGFCSTKEFWQRQFRNRSPRHVVTEMEELRRHGKTDIYFNDDIFTIRRKWVLELCDLLIERDLGIKWACGTRVDRVDLQLLSKMKEAGCVYVYYGVETGSETINQGQMKGASIAKIEKAYSLLRDVGIFSSAAIIFGLPGESLDTARASINWLRDVVRPDEIWISKATCYPGTALAAHFGIDAADYEYRYRGQSEKGLPYGTGGIYTPFFNDSDLVRRIWDYAREELSHLSVEFGDDRGMPFVGGLEFEGRVDEKFERMPIA